MDHSEEKVHEHAKRREKKRTPSMKVSGRGMKRFAVPKRKKKEVKK